MHCCVLCSARKLRNLDHGFYQCCFCRSVLNTRYEAVTYEHDYFLTEYREQYGRTYEEDYDHIYSQSCRRLFQIKELYAGEFHGASLYEIGSAMGFFLKCARDKGMYNVTGLEISDYAVRYCREKFGIDVASRPFALDLMESSYDVIAAWYVLEHFPDPGSLFGHLYSALRDRGVLAFSLPSVYGPLFSRHRDRWFASHPSDHSFDGHPRGIKKYLRSLGFKRVVTLPGGYHPERVMERSHVLFPFFEPLYAIWSRLFCFSDTMEVYAVK